MPRRPPAHCATCGLRFDPAAAWPRRCAGCERISYLNPLPVAVTLTPVGDGLLAIERGIPPFVGGLALPGGFIDLGETWQGACARELLEETGLSFPAAAVRHFATLTDPEGYLLVFGVTPPIDPAALPRGAPSDEVLACRVLRAPAEMVFPLHTEAARLWFAHYSSS